MILGLDASLGVPLLAAYHPDHERVLRWSQGRRLALCGHALIETYSVVTRFSGGKRIAARDAARLLRERFEPPVPQASSIDRGDVEHWAGLGIEGGAVYDALVAMAAVEHDVTLASRDARARRTYDAVGARVVLVT